MKDMVKNPKAGRARPGRGDSPASGQIRPSVPARSRSLVPEQLALVAGAVLSAAGFICAFTIAPLVFGAEVVPELVGDTMVQNQLLFSQKIFYFHMPVALVSFVAVACQAAFSIAYLKTRRPVWDLRARTAMEVGLVFIVCTMATGVAWTRFEWGVWWTWEPRLTTYLVLMLLAFAYFVLRRAFDGQERQGVLAAVFGILAFVDVPICFAVTRLIPNTTHPVIVRSGGGMTVEMVVALLLALAGIALVAWALYRLRLRQASVAARIVALKDMLEQD
jgi:heme exporter protein C